MEITGAQYADNSPCCAQRGHVPMYRLRLRVVVLSNKRGNQGHSDLFRFFTPFIFKRTCQLQLP